MPTAPSEIFAEELPMKHDPQPPFESKAKGAVTAIHPVTPAAPASEQQAEDAGPDRRWDEELKVIAAILRLLDKVDESAKPRIVAYITDRHQKLDAF